ncbi:MAG: phosphoethanolamine transferase [Sterolibacteriaceae bacterium]|nr:phosphoethanolamine transferase [Candidatus Methylophosphatis haderslevensis]
MNSISKKLHLSYAWWVFWGIVLVWNIPNMIPWERNLYPGAYLLDLQERLFKCALLATMFLALFARPWMGWLASWLLGLWWLPASVAVRWLSDSPITSSLVGMAIASSPGELKNLALSVPPLVLAGFLGWNIVCAVLLSWLKRRTAWHWGYAARGKILVFCGMLLLIPYALASKSQSAPHLQNAARQSIDPFEEGDRQIGSDAELPRAFPYELPWAAAQYWQARSVVDVAVAGLRAMPAGQTLPVSVGPPDTVVLVIGESSSRNAWHLFNPDQAETTPRLDARMAKGDALFAFTNVVAQSTSTRQAVPSMLTPQPLLWPDGKPNPQATRSIISLASRAGYATSWFSNQAAVGRFDGVIAAYADEADTRAFLNPSSYFQQGSYDEVLLPAVQRYVASHPKAFIVLHTMGSHFRFDHRYPPGFGLFPGHQGIKQTYRNSVAYTDALLDQIIDILAGDGRSAVMVYASDHGQGLTDEQCNKTTINRVTIDSYEVPALVWLSPAYVAAHPAASKLLRSNAKLPYTTAAIHQTLKDLMSGPEMVADEPAVKDMGSFLRQQWDGMPQMVVAPNMRWVDFREAAARDPCFIKGN